MQPMTDRKARKKIVVTGGTGFLGGPLVSALAARGDDVTVLSRSRSPKHLPTGVIALQWTPDASPSAQTSADEKAEPAWYSAIDGADAVLHLAGEPIFGRWTDERRKRAYDSRVHSTEQIVAAIEAAKARPRVLVSASAIGYYGAWAGDAPFTETSPPGDDFLAKLVVAWENAAKPAEALGVRVVHVRIGVVLGRNGGALAPMLPAFKFFVGGPMGSGKQVISWIHEHDMHGILRFALDDDTVSGPINGTAPAPATNEELSRALGDALHRPSWLKVPAFVLKGALGEASMLVLGGQRVLPEKTMELGYEFQYTDLPAALSSLV